MSTNEFFPLEVLSRWERYKSLDTPVNYFHHLHNNVLRLCPAWSSSFVVHDVVFDHKGVTYWMFHMSFMRDEELLSEYGVGKTKSWARDTCAFRLFLLLEREQPDFLMPPYLIGFPNVRGHCYLIAAVMPLLHSYPFIWRLFEVYGRVSRESNMGLIEGRPPRRGETESAFYWTRIMFDLYFKYFKVSSTSRLLQVNVPNLARRMELAPVIFPRYDPEYQHDLELDRVLVNNVCASLRDFCTNFYATPGGFEEEAYSDLLYKLASEDEIWLKDFFFKFECRYACSRCTNRLTEGSFAIPVIRLPKDVSFQEGLDNLDHLLSQQRINCNNQISEYTCHGTVRKVEDVRVNGFPRVLCFVVHPEQQVRYPIPDSITLDLGNDSDDYVRFANSNCFSCWKVKVGDVWRSYGDLYHVPVEGDVLTGYHTYTTLETTDGFFESNNGSLYTPDSRLLLNVTAGSLHYFHRRGYNNFLPKININEVYVNPEF